MTTISIAPATAGRSARSAINFANGEVDRGMRPTATLKMREFPPMGGFLGDGHAQSRQLGDSEKPHTPPRSSGQLGHLIPKAVAGRSASPFANLQKVRQPAQRPADKSANLQTYRADVEAEIEHLLALLDDLDGDPDLEDGRDAEPMLGWPENRARPYTDWNATATDDDAEPSLGSIEDHPCDHRRPNYWGELVGTFTGTVPEGDQTRWAGGGADDREDEHDGLEDLREDYEDVGDDEPSLGSCNASPRRTFVDGNSIWPGQMMVFDAGIDQRNWAMGASDDREGEHDGREGEDGVR